MACGTPPLVLRASRPGRRRRATLAGHWRDASIEPARDDRARHPRVLRRDRDRLALAGERAGPDPALATGPLHAPPQAGYPLGTDNFGRSVLDLLIAGARVSLLVGITAAIGAMLIGAVVGISAGYFGGTKIDTVLNALDELVPRDPVARARDRARVGARRQPDQRDHRDRDHLVGRDGAARPRAVAHRQGALLRRAIARAWAASNWHVITRHVLPNVFPVLFANTILMVALAILSETTLAILGLSDPIAISWGKTIEASFTRGRGDRRLVVVADPAGCLHRAGDARLHDGRVRAR